jgi:hypothetical protein
MTAPHHIDNHTIHVTVFDNAAATDKATHTYELTLPQISDMVQRASAPTKSQLPWMKMARFGKLRTPKGSLRNNANVRSISGVELDFDGENVSFDDALAKLKKLNCTAFVYTSPSHTKEKPRWRVLFPTSRELEDPATRRVLAARIDGYFDNIFDPASFTLSQSFYFGRALDNPNPDHRVAIVDGMFIDQRPDLEIFDDVVARQHVRQPPERQNRTPVTALAYEPAVAAMMEADAGKGLSTDPDDYFPDDPDPELKIWVALSVVPSDDYDVWYRIGAAIYAALGDAGYALFDEWSRESAKYDPRACERKWRECAKMRSIGAKTIFWYADQHDRGWRTFYKRLLNGEVAA